MTACSTFRLFGRVRHFLLKKLGYMRQKGPNEYAHLLNVLFQRKKWSGKIVKPMSSIHFAMELEKMEKWISLGNLNVILDPHLSQCFLMIQLEGIRPADVFPTFVPWHSRHTKRAAANERQRGATYRLQPNPIASRGHAVPSDAIGMGGPWAKTEWRHSSPPCNSARLKEAGHSRRQMQASSRRVGKPIEWLVWFHDTTTSEANTHHVIDLISRRRRALMLQIWRQSAPPPGPPLTRVNASESIQRTVGQCKQRR